MMVQRTVLRVVLALGVVTALVWPAAPEAQGAGPDVAVVVHPEVQVDSLTRAELRKILLGDRAFWNAGQRVSLLLRAPIAHEREAAIKNICDMTEAQFRQHWIAKVFRADTGSGPRIVYSSQMAIEEVARTPGAITFVEAPVSNRTVKVLRIDGKTPGQPGYGVK